ncbi:hypothetical protein IEQ34_008644 [Dendrobium chrysotoxum]|uniref:Uncharacterized protein n=1 Tax=Dendrobium chrysotoxum TaxID=161865 RepID=A0AAV7GH47_DENCH|nr:hypothetical protein IEQ34_008644 [Dendrobium chrysotoxum]
MTSMDSEPSNDAGTGDPDPDPDPDPDTDDLLPIRYLEISDHAKGFVELLGQLSPCPPISVAEFCSRFAELAALGDDHIICNIISRYTNFTLDVDYLTQPSSSKAWDVVKPRGANESSRARVRPNSSSTREPNHEIDSPSKNKSSSGLRVQFTNGFRHSHTVPHLAFDSSHATFRRSVFRPYRSGFGPPPFGLPPPPFHLPRTARLVIELSGRLFELELDKPNEFEILLELDSRAH